MQGTGLKRSSSNNEKFYTKPEVVMKCLNEFKKLNVKKNHLVIEPSAGNGSFTVHLLEYNNLSYDIAPEAKGIIKQDFLRLNLTSSFNLPLYFIGNPPFGRQSSIAKKFIKHICACNQTKGFGFILPKSFKKESMQKCISLDFHIVSEIDIQDNSFTVNGKDYDVPCIFQVWERRNENRYVSPKLETIGYNFEKEKIKGRYALRRVGVYAGKILDMFNHPIGDISEQSHYFIKLDKQDEKFIEKYEASINFEHNNTVGPKSISKQEFIKELNKLF